MSMNSFHRLFTMAVAGLMIQGCASLPTVTPRTATTTLPAAFRPGAVPEKPIPQLIPWKQYFSDPDLVALIDIAIANNKEVGIAMQRIDVARNEIQARRGEYKPFVKVGATAGADKVGEFTRNGAVEENLPLKEEKRFPTFLGDFQFGLFSNWELDVWRKLHNAARAAVFEYMATVEGKNFLITELVAEVARAYYELEALDNQRENLEQNIRFQQNGLEMVRQLMLYARSNALAVQRYEAEVAKNQSRVFEIAQQITVTENRINFLLGRTPQPIARHSAEFMSYLPRTLVTGVPSQLLENRPDIRKAELELAAAELNVRVAQKNFYPSFAIKAGTGFNAFSPRFLLDAPQSVAASLAGEMVAPLVNKRAIKAEYKSANARQIQAAFEYEQKIVNAFVEVANQLSNIENLEKNLALKRSQVDLLMQAIDTATLMFKSARVDYLDVLLTQREALEAKKELIETKEKEIVATVDLYKALGGGWQ